jgi:hypothetical protein
MDQMRIDLSIDADATRLWMEEEADLEKFMDSMEFM